MSKKVIYAHLSSLSTSELKQLSLLLDPKVCSKKEVILILLSLSLKYMSIVSSKIYFPMFFWWFAFKPVCFSKFCHHFYFFWIHFLTKISIYSISFSDQTSTTHCLRYASIYSIGRRVKSLGIKLALRLVIQRPPHWLPNIYLLGTYYLQLLGEDLQSLLIPLQSSSFSSLLTLFHVRADCNDTRVFGLHYNLYVCRDIKNFTCMVNYY